MQTILGRTFAALIVLLSGCDDFDRPERREFKSSAEKRHEAWQEAERRAFLEELNRRRAEQGLPPIEERNINAKP